ncbi:glycosyltransferase family 4 protein [Hahella sp. CR1]|uniref:glycosyltransferase family 4 protein n=1 Tax=unclassified Hahella TaxID=2624107 RepID=UPI002441CFA7|nr:glycosyltransferase family 1 protein [Hahella sp. CR1]MDG9669547.1 glycosyltransferase family 1 protein [Hahella sp. CR1]
MILKHSLQDIQGRAAEAERERPRPKIAIVTETFFPEINGVANTLRYVSEGLSRQYRVQVVRPNQPLGERRELIDAMEHILVRGRPIPGYGELKFGLPCRRRLLKAWRQDTPSAVYVATQGPLGWSAVSAATELGVPVVSGFHTNFHSYSAFYGFGWLTKLITRYLTWFHHRTLLTLTPTRQTAEAVSQMGVRNTRVWSRGVDCSQFNPSLRCQHLREEWGVREESPVFIYVGRLASEKNIHLAIAAFRRAQQQVSKARMVMVGGGPLRERIAAKHPDIILAGVKRGDDLARHYASADIFLFPSLTDTFGNVVLEAMASGLGIVSFDDAAAREHLEHEVSGMLAPQQDCDAFCRHALTLALRPSHLKRLRAAARGRALPLDWSQIVDRFAHILLSGEAKGEQQHESAKSLRAVSPS